MEPRRWPSTAVTGKSVHATGANSIAACAHLFLEHAAPRREHCSNYPSESTPTTALCVSTPPCLLRPSPPSRSLDRLLIDVDEDIMTWNRRARQALAPVKGICGNQPSLTHAFLNRAHIESPAMRTRHLVAHINHARAGWTVGRLPSTLRFPLCFGWTAASRPHILKIVGERRVEWRRGVF